MDPMVGRSTRKKSENLQIKFVDKIRTIPYNENNLRKSFDGKEVRFEETRQRAAGWCEAAGDQIRIHSTMLSAEGENSLVDRTGILHPLQC